MLIQSLYTHIFERDKHFYLYNSCSGLFCEISQETYAALYNRDYSCIEEDTLEFLTQKKVLVPEDEKYLYYLESRSLHYSDANNPSNLGLVIAPTIGCNFNCPYCFEAKTNNSIMSDEVESQLIDFIKHYENAKTISLTWYGGEPLLAFKRIKSIWNRIRNEFPDIKISYHSIVTNGWLISDQIIEFFKEAGLKSIQITLDGVKVNHDKTRCLKDGTPTFDKIYMNILRIAKEIPSLKVSVRVNVSRSNPDDFSAISALFREEGINNISVYAGFIREDTPDGRSLTYNSFDRKGCHDFYISTAEHGTKAKFFPSLSKSKGCMITSSFSFIVGPEGEIYKCWNDMGHSDRVIGNIASNGQENRVRLFRYLNETSCFSDSQCKECKVFPVCSGGCGHYRYRNKFENGQFNLCTRFKDDKVLEDSLLQ